VLGRRRRRQPSSQSGKILLQNRFVGTEKRKTEMRLLSPMVPDKIGMVGRYGTIPYTLDIIVPRHSVTNQTFCCTKQSMVFNCKTIIL
jgi:hypothetical protein